MHNTGYLTVCDLNACSHFKDKVSVSILFQNNCSYFCGLFHVISHHFSDKAHVYTHQR
jgi:hypothetical protein